MRVAVIGADRPWGALLAAELGAEFEVVAIGAEETSDLAGYRQVDLLQCEALDPELAGVEAIVHAASVTNPINQTGLIVRDQQRTVGHHENINRPPPVRFSL